MSMPIVRAYTTSACTTIINGARSLVAWIAKSQDLLAIRVDRVRHVASDTVSNTIPFLSVEYVIHDGLPDLKSHQTRKR